MSTSHNSSSRDEAKRPSAQEKGNATQIQKPGEEDSHTLVAYDDTHLGAEAASEHPAERDDKSAVLAKDFRTMAKISVVFILIVAGLALAGYLLKFIWVGLLPVLLAILVSTVLYPISAWLRSKGFPRSLAAVSTLLGLIIVFCGVFAAMAPVVTSQSQTLIDQAEDGINQITEMVEKSPIDIQSDQLQSVLQDVVKFAKGQASTIATGVISGFSMASSIVVAALIMLFVTFFIIKDGDKFLPWLRKYTGNSTGWHVTELGARIWKTLSGFIQAQAAVAMVDAVLIGLGLWVLQVPLALVIAVVTFFASFIPIIGAVTAGALAIIIALVSNGLTNALLALALIIIVQQVEGNVLQPMLQSKAMGLHAAVVLLSVTVGSTLAGIVGAFLAVPVAATIAVVVRYHAEMAALRSGEVEASDIDIITGSKDDPEDFSDVTYEHDETPRDKVEQLYQSMSPLS
ncbi:AI-2E family transporter [Corynebacterium tuberculostearicum]|uniref:AI-2E family transporter n=1 Tax=Corynebacterium tuberculostearicum TaxID=38304 RepID=UPI002025F29B|nr:AI-2E family transporter [Corynebacterium tuberculostearicum]MCG7458572.1 AI-2E family transporter [Corynebacterium tuberculostearicum]